VSPTPRPASAAWMSLPTAVEPVKATLSTPERTSAAPATPSPVTMFATPAGTSASWKISASSSAVSGVVSAGLRIAALPHASAGGLLGGRDVGLAGEGDLAHRLLRGRADRWHAAPVARVDELAADEEPVAVAQADVVGGLGRRGVVPGDARARGVFGGSHGWL